MRIEFDEGTLLLREVSENVLYAEWDERVEEHRAPAYRYRPLLEWADAWDSATSRSGVQKSIHSSLEAVHIEEEPEQ